MPWRRILHGERSFTLSRPLPAQATVRGHHSVVAVDDKGSRRGAVLYTAQDLVEAENGEPLASLQSAEFLRDEGGSGGFGAPPTLTRPMGSVDEPTAVVDYRTSPQAALLYRQASRDYMPIHARSASRAALRSSISRRAIRKNSYRCRFGSRRRPIPATPFASNFSQRRKERVSARAPWSDAFWSWNVEKFNWRERHRPLAASEAWRSLPALQGEENAPIPAMADIVMLPAP